jgi:hypothetical protein
VPIECIVKSSTAQSRTEISCFAFCALLSMLPGQQPPGYEFSSCSRPAPVGLRADHVVPGAARNLGVRYGAHICVSLFLDAWKTYRLAARFYPANADVKSKETRRPALQVRCRCRESIHRCIRNGRPEFQVTLSIIFLHVQCTHIDWEVWRRSRAYRTACNAQSSALHARISFSWAATNAISLTKTSRSPR